MTPIKIYFMKCNKFRKTLNCKILYIFNKVFAFSVICSRCSKNNGEIFKDK